MTLKEDLIAVIDKHQYDIPIKAKSIYIAEFIISILRRLEIFTEHRDEIDQ